jgi:hypothetical protein
MLGGWTHMLGGWTHMSGGWGGTYMSDGLGNVKPSSQMDWVRRPRMSCGLGWVGWGGAPVFWGVGGGGGGVGQDPHVSWVVCGCVGPT